MAPRLSEVWLRLYQLAEAFEANGSNYNDQLKSVMQQWLTMPPELKYQSLQRLDKLSRFTSHVAIACRDGANEPVP
jgi:hypothetical protein